MHKTFFDLASTKFLPSLLTPYDPIMLSNMKFPLTHCDFAHAAPSAYIILPHCAQRLLIFQDSAFEPSS